MKTIHEVKKGLECCIGQYSASCGKCPYSNDGKDCGRNGVQIMKDALECIEQLERERDALHYDLSTQDDAIVLVQALVLVQERLRRIVRG